VTPDVAAVVLNMAVLTAVLQAAGGVIFMRVFGNDLGGASTLVHRLVRVAATTGIVLVLARQGIEAARFAGDFAGIWDAQLQRLAWGSRDGYAHVAQLLALAAIIRSPGAPRLPVSRIAVLGAVAAAGAFATTGHASAHSARALLVPVLAVHTLAAAFWFGSLAPLLIVVRNLPAAIAARVLTRFSLIARWSVVALVIAAVTLAVALSPGLQVLKQPYGAMLIVKAAVLVALLALALFNSRRGLTGLVRRQPRAATALQLSIAAEAGLMAAVLTATAVLTTLFSPEG
jgi:putative copper export protein